MGNISGMDSNEVKEKSPELVVADGSEATAFDVDKHPTLEISVKQTVDDLDDLIGITIGGHYEILEKIGDGGMSAVYKARHLLLDKIVAIKFIHPKLIHDKQTVMRFQQEAKAASELSHENICGVREFEIHEANRAFLVMDFVEGKSLTQLLREEGKLTQERALGIARELGRGLMHAHAKGVVHRDIKPGNIMLVRNADGDESVKIVDFGIAKVLREDQAGPNLTQTGEVFGTPNYMSPEQCLGRKVDSRTDIYSVGCVLHEMVFGEPPFAGSSSIEVIVNHVNQVPKLNSSQPIEALIMKCLEKSAEDRYAHISDLIADIDSLSSKQNLIHAKPTRSSARTSVGIALILVFSVFTLILASMGYKAYSENLQFQNKWSVENQVSTRLIQEERWTEAEASLEKQLDLARQSKNGQLVTQSITELARVEKQLGKTEEASMHLAESTTRPIEKLKMFFMGTAATFIVLGVITLILFLFLFGPNGRVNKAMLTRPLYEVLKPGKRR